MKAKGKILLMFILAFYLGFIFCIMLCGITKMGLNLYNMRTRTLEVKLMQLEQKAINLNHKILLRESKHNE